MQECMVFSPMKSNTVGTTKYFHAHLTDGNTTARVVGFDAKVHQRLCSFHERKEPVVMSNCEVKCSKYTNDLEVVVRNSCEFEKSPTKYNLSSESESEIILNEVSSLAKGYRSSEDCWNE